MERPTRNQNLCSGEAAAELEDHRALEEGVGVGEQVVHQRYLGEEGAVEELEDR